MTTRPFSSTSDEMSLPSFDIGFSTEELAAVFSPKSTVAAMLEFEAALAMALADTGIAPRGAAEDVATACRKGVAEPERILASTWETGTPLIELKDTITATIDDEEARRWFHFGATSQDAIDTGQMMQAGSALEIIDSRLSPLARLLRDLTVEYRDQPQMGRTFLQDARPTTFGFRTATWLDAVLHHVDAFRRQRTSLVVQLGGPVGTMAAYGDASPAVVASLADQLGLGVPDISWHADRTRVVALAQAVGRLAATMGKVGTDIALLSSTGIDEISVRTGGSSSMPEKENPIDAMRAVAAAGACAGAVAMLTSRSGHELDRGIGDWHVEWLALPLTFQTAGAAVEAIAACIASLHVDRETMTANAGATATAPSTSIDRVLASFDRLVG